MDFEDGPSRAALTLQLTRILNKGPGKEALGGNKAEVFDDKWFDEQMTLLIKELEFLDIHVRMGRVHCKQRSI